MCFSFRAKIVGGVLLRTHRLASHSAESIGRPLGGDRFLAAIERRTGVLSSRANAGRNRLDLKTVNPHYR
jgi:hypothetical protein